MVRDILLLHMVDGIGLVPIVNKFLDGSREFDGFIFFGRRADEIQPTVCVRAHDNAANCPPRPKILCKRLVQHGITHEEMSFGNLRQGLAIPCITQNREYGAVVLHRLTHRAPIDLFHLLDNVCRNINDH